MDLPIKVFDYLNGHHMSMSRNEIRFLIFSLSEFKTDNNRFCTHLIIVILKSSRKEISEKYLEMETKWIHERTTDSYVHEIHISNIKNAVSFPNAHAMKPSIQALADSVCSSIEHFIEIK